MTIDPQSGKSINVLLVEDNPGDVRLTQEALNEGKIPNKLYVVNDGKEALDFLFLRKKYRNAICPDLLLLDLNLPKMDGREVLKKIKEHPRLKDIPVVVLSTSSAEKDILQNYDSRTNCYITKPVDLEQFLMFIKTLKKFWLSITNQPRR